MDATFGGSDAAIGYLDGDGLPDVLLAGGTGSAVKLGRLTAGRHTLESITGGMRLGSGAVALGDLDGDGDLDLVHEGQVYLNDGTATFTTAGAPMSGSIRDLVDLDGDGDLDAITRVQGNYSNGVPDELRIWLNQ